jgi:hypothetical protein
MWRFYRRAAEKLQHELRLLLLCAATAQELAVSFICSSPPLICLCTLIVLTVLIWSHSSLLFFSFVLQLEIHLRILTTPTNHLFFFALYATATRKVSFFFFVLISSSTPRFPRFFCFSQLPPPSQLSLFVSGCSSPSFLIHRHPASTKLNTYIRLKDPD